jgi:hypothetical protein
MSKSKYEGLEGKKYNRLTLINGYFVGETYKYECLCECGKTVSVSANKIVGSAKLKQTKSCGCYRTEKIIERSTKHGKSKKTNEYFAWCSMKERCNNPNVPSYINYGGRGIKVCDEWLNSFETFFKDMGERPSPTHSIDRIDNSKGYSKENCKWSTKTEQALNQRIYKNNTSGCVGVHIDTKTKQWRAQIRYNKKGHTIGRYETFEEAKKARLEAELKYFGRIVSR